MFKKGSFFRQHHNRQIWYSKMAIIKFAYQCKEVNDQNKFQKAKDYMKEIVQHRFRHTSFGLYAKYDPKDDSITLWLTQPSDTKLFLENVLDSDIEALTGNKEVGFHIAKGEGGFLKKRELEDLTKRWPIQIGQLSEKQMADAFEMIDSAFEQFKQQAKQAQQPKR